MAGDLRPQSDRHFSIAHLFLFGFVVAVVLAAGRQFPNLPRIAAPFLPALLLVASVAFVTRNRALFVAGVVGGLLGYYVNPREPPSALWSGSPIWWGVQAKGVLGGAILFLAVAHGVRRLRRPPQLGSARRPYADLMPEPVFEEIAED